MFKVKYSEIVNMKLTNAFVGFILFISVASADSFDQFRKVAADLEFRVASDVVLLVSDKERTFQGMIVDIRFLKEQELKAARSVLTAHDVQYALNETYQSKYAFFFISSLNGEENAKKQKEKLLAALKESNPVTTGIIHLIRELGLPSAHAGVEPEICEPEVDSSIRNITSPLQHLNRPAAECLTAGITRPEDIRRENEAAGYPSPVEMAKGCGDGVIDVVTSTSMLFAPGNDLRWTREVGLSNQGLEDLMVSPLIGPIGLINAADRTLNGLATAKDRFAHWYMENRGQIFKAVAHEAEMEVNKLLCLTRKAQVELLCQIITIYARGVPVKAAAIQSVKSAVSKVYRFTKASSAIGRRLTSEELAAIERAHHVGAGQMGRDGGPARVGFYTDAQIAEKARILSSVGTLSREERRILMEKGVVGYWGSWLAGFEQVTGNKRVRYYNDRSGWSYKEIQMKDNFGNWKTTYNGRTNRAPDWVD